MIFITSYWPRAIVRIKIYNNTEIITQKGNYSTLYIRQVSVMCRVHTYSADVPQLFISNPIQTDLH